MLNIIKNDIKSIVNVFPYILQRQICAISSMYIYICMYNMAVNFPSDIGTVIASLQFTSSIELISN